MNVAINGAQRGDDEVLSEALQHVRAGRWQEAQAICHALLNAHPEHPQAYYVLGAIGYLIGRPDIAMNLFQRSASLQPSPEAFYNVGLTLARMGRHSEALAAYHQALVLRPDNADVLNAVGFAYAHLGNAKHAIGNYRRALAARAGFRLAVENLAALVSPAEAIDHCTAMLVHPIATEDRFVIMVQRAMAEWLLGRFEGLRRTLINAEPLLPEPGKANTHQKNMRAFHRHLTLLLQHHDSVTPANLGAGKQTASEEEHQSRRGGVFGRLLRGRRPTAVGSPVEPPPTGDPNALFGIGDAHLLSFATATLDVAGAPCTIEGAALPISQRARELGLAETHPDVTALEACVARIPDGSRILCSFGELDCRFNEGIMRDWKRSGGDLETVIAPQVNGYVARIAGLARPRSIPVLFAGVPAPRPGGGKDVPTNDVRLHMAIVECFNRNLRRAARAAGQGLVDVYALTAGINGLASGEHHIDNIHLRPDALRRAAILLPGSEQ